MGGEVIFMRPVYFIGDHPHKTNKGGMNEHGFAARGQARPLPKLMLHHHLESGYAEHHLVLLTWSMVQASLA